MPKSKAAQNDCLTPHIAEPDLQSILDRLADARIFDERVILPSLQSEQTNESDSVSPD